VNEHLIAKYIFFNYSTCNSFFFFFFFFFFFMYIHKYTYDNLLFFIPYIFNNEYKALRIKIKKRFKLVKIQIH